MVPPWIRDNETRDKLNSYFDSFFCKSKILSWHLFTKNPIGLDDLQLLLKSLWAWFSLAHDLMGLCLAPNSITHLKHHSSKIWTRYGWVYVFANHYFGNCPNLVRGKGALVSPIIKCCSSTCRTCLVLPVSFREMHAFFLYHKTCVCPFLFLYRSCCPLKRSLEL